MTKPNLANLQGDLFSRGFPKYNETYYFFSIVVGKEKDFTRALTALKQSQAISSLEKVLNDWKTIADTNANRNVDGKKILPLTNALIAFSKKGLERIQIGLPQGKSLGLADLATSDPAFNAGMATDGQGNLNDPALSEWDTLFTSETSPIHGILKIAGNSADTVISKLNEIKKILGHPCIIADIATQTPPSTSVNSRLDGQVRPESLGLKGHEHFGFRDGVSQPLLKGIDTPADFSKTKSMQTDRNKIMVTIPPADPTGGTEANPFKRPPWMVDGSFLVFRKFEQDVQGFQTLTAKFGSAACTTADQCGAKLMGRWMSGAPIVKFPDQDPTGEANATNDFEFAPGKRNVCPLAAHIRKTNPRDGTDKTLNARIVRNGIPYGTELSVDKTAKRGLLFACYQSSIENGFQFIQKAWCNNVDFPGGRNAGFDAFIGQPPSNGDLQTTMYQVDQTECDPGLGAFRKLVTMKGGEYFFVPSISALSDTLGST